MKGHQNSIGSRATAVLLHWWILPIGGVASGRVSACSLRFKNILLHPFTNVKSQIDLLQKDSLLKSKGRSLASEIAILSLKW